MVKLPMSDYVANYYKEQGIEFTFRQQAHFCWYYSELLKEQLGSLKEILKISDDEKLNTEIRERIAYEEKAYECFMTEQDGCIYIVRSDDKDEYEEEYFASAKKAIAYGTHNCDEYFEVIKSWLFDKNPKGLSEEAGDDDSENANEILSWYRYTSDGDVIYGFSYEYKVPFDEYDISRFENMFLNIKSPFGLGDIVMGSDFDEPRVVSTEHDCFEETYNKLKNHEYLRPSALDNSIRTDYIGEDGNAYYDHTIPFNLWKVDSWENEEYWELLQITRHAVENGVDPFEFDYFHRQYGVHNDKGKDSGRTERK